MTFAYRIETAPDDNGSFLITSPDLPEVTSFAEERTEIPARALDAIEEAIAARIASGADLPSGHPPGEGAVSLPLLAAIKVGLYQACRERGVIRADLARRLNWNRESVDRLFRLDHQSRLEQLEAAFRALGLAVDIRIEAQGEERREYA